MQQLQQMVARLREHPRVVALVEFGSAHYQDRFKSGDYDILVILDKMEQQVTSLHFNIGDIPVDLNLRGIGWLRNLNSVTGFERAFVGGRVIFDSTGEVERLISELAEKNRVDSTYLLAENDVARVRHWHKHVLDKVRGRLDARPTFCHFLLSTNIFWLLENYFRVRQLEYAGPKKAFDYLMDHEPQIYERIVRLYEASDLNAKVKITEDLTALVLEPVGGMPRDSDILVFGSDSLQSLQEQGQRILQMLLPELSVRRRSEDNDSPDE